MKINIEIDLTPEEAREALGLPDLKPMQSELLEQMSEQLKRNAAYVDPELIVKTLLPMGAEGIERFQKMLWGMARTAVGDTGESDSRETKSGRKGK